MKLSAEQIHQIISFFPLLFACGLGGMNQGWVAPVLKLSEDPNYDIHLTSNQISWVASLQEPFKVLGIICCVTTIDVLGRRIMLIFISLLHLIGWALIRFTRLVFFILVSRSTHGLMNGFIDSTMIIYLGENISPELRGVNASLCATFFFSGLLIQYTLASYLSYNTVAILNIICGVLHFLSTFLMKETVQYLITKKRYQQAERNYQWLFSQDKKEFEKLKNMVNASTMVSLTLKEFFSTPAFYKSVSIAVLLTLLAYSCGFWTLIAYTSIAFTSSNDLTPNQFTIIYGLIQLMTSFSSSLIIECLHRRTVLLIATAAAALSHATSATLYYVQENVNPIPYFPWMIFASITLFMMLAAPGIIRISILLRSELFPQKIKPFGVGSANLAGCLGIFLTSITFIRIAEIIGMFANFLIFSAICAMIFLFAYFFVPETRGKSLTEIQQSFTMADTNDNT